MSTTIVPANTAADLHSIVLQLEDRSLKIVGTLQFMLEAYTDTNRLSDAAAISTVLDLARESDALVDSIKFHPANKHGGLPPLTPEIIRLQDVSSEIQSAVEAADLHEVPQEALRHAAEVVERARLQVVRAIMPNAG